MELTTNGGGAKCGATPLAFNIFSTKNSVFSAPVGA